ncbi:hypothetical protein AB0M58_27440 [Streptomyces bobili]|uniref:hypothetical protein n=1 Tax=Streptomyces bobili TaxID=67280 RepID=UPI003426C617
MAGFDFEFTYTEAQEAIVRICLAAAQTRARKMGLSWRWRHPQTHRCVVTINGNSRQTDLLGYRLERDLPLVAEGCADAGLPPAQRARIGRGFADMMLRGRHVEQDDPMVLRGVAATSYYYSPYEYECPSSPRLHARLSITTDLIVAWNFAEIAPEVLLEELHTACELVLEELVNRRAKKLSFAQLISAADEADLFRHSSDQAVPTTDLLTELKDLRKDVRHRAAEGADVWLDKHWENVAMCLECLVHHVNDQGGQS